MKTGIPNYKLVSLILILGFLYACSKLEPSAPDPDTVMDGNLEGLTHGQHRIFLQGAEEFDEIYNTNSGLGPIFVSNACASCHAGDNRGHLFTTLTRFGQADTNGNTFLSQGGPQLQHQAMPGFEPEKIPSGAASTRLVAPIVAGLGFLEAVPEQSILNLADPFDMDGDGISGVPCYNELPSWVVPSSNSIPRGGKYLCRFGRKGSTYNLFQQTVQAFNQDIGITTSYMPTNPENPKGGLYPVSSQTVDIEDESVNATVLYLQAIQAPIQRNNGNSNVKKGEAVFAMIGCEKCHKKTLKTGASPLKPLDQKEFNAYTDLLLHDMGPGLDDGYTEGTAETWEWRTPPLWGLGLATQATGGDYFLMHDGRARSIEEAIKLHGGEGVYSNNAYQALTKEEKDALMSFLESL